MLITLKIKKTRLVRFYREAVRVNNNMVGEVRFELTTSRVQGGYANQAALFSDIWLQISDSN